MTSVYIIGSAGHAKVVVDAIEKQGKYTIAGLIDDYRSVGSKTLDYQVLGNIEWLERKVSSQPLQTYLVFIAVGANYARDAIATRLSPLSNIAYISVIHPSANVSHYATIGDGCFIAAQSTVGVDAIIHDHSIINHNANIDHDSILYSFSSIAPSASLAGGVSVGERSCIGIGAVVIEKISIGCDVVIGAGAVVIDVIGSQVVAIGSPAKAIKHRKKNQSYLR